MEEEEERAAKAKKVSREMWERSPEFRLAPSSTD